MHLGQTDNVPAWLNNKQVSRLVLAIISKETRETLERWQFEITLEDRVGATKGGEGDKENEYAPTFVTCPIIDLLPVTGQDCKKMRKTERRKN